MWDPPLAWATQRYDVHFTVATGVDAPAAARRDDRAAGGRGRARATRSNSPALSPIVTITGSLVLGLALIERAMEAEAVWAAANLDEDWQAEQWGEDPLAVQARAVRRARIRRGGAVSGFASLLKRARHRSRSSTKRAIARNQIGLGTEPAQMIDRLVDQHRRLLLGAVDP